MGISFLIVSLRTVGVILTRSIGGGGGDAVLSFASVPHDPPSACDEVSEVEDTGPDVVRLTSSGFGEEALA